MEDTKIRVNEKYSKLSNFETPGENENMLTATVMLLLVTLMVAGSSTKKAEQGTQTL